jgi:hypothetical protein
MPTNLIIGYGKPFSKPDKITPTMSANQNEKAIHIQEIDFHFEEIEQLEENIKKKPSSNQVPAWKKRVRLLRRTIEHANDEFRNRNKLRKK